MQAFKAKATVSNDRELHIAHVPFAPGAEVDIILLGSEAGKAESDEFESVHETTNQRRVGAVSEHADDRVTAADQYRLAEKYPGEYVLLAGARTIHHSPDREEIVTAYRQAWTDSPAERPVVVAPGGAPRQRPFFRGRSLSTILSK